VDEMAAGAGGDSGQDALATEWPIPTIGDLRGSAI
jgi:hypothetical protein